MSAKAVLHIAAPTTEKLRREPTRIEAAALVDAGFMPASHFHELFGTKDTGPTVLRWGRAH